MSGGAVYSGDVRFVEVDGDGVPTGAYLGPFNTQLLQITVPDPDATTRESKMNDSLGQALDQIFKPKPTEIAVNIDDMDDATVLGWALNAVPEDFTQGTGSFAEATVAVEKGKWYYTGKRYIDNVVVKHSSGTPTYTLNVDYAVASEAGFIKILSGGAIATGNVKLSYDYAALTGKKVSIGSRASVQLRIEGDMVNLANGNRGFLVVPFAKCSPSGGLDMFGNDFLVAQLKGTLIKLPGQSVADFIKPVTS